MNNNSRILLVEDDENLGFVTKDNLEEEGFLVDWAKNGNEGYNRFCSGTYDIAILDVMLPEKDGFELAGDIRKVNQHLPIIFLTAKALNADKIEGFKTGGDDYITKPYNFEELKYRVQAILKRTLSSNENQDSNNFALGQYAFDFSNQELSLAGEKKHLTKKEAEILRLLCLHRNQLLTRENALKIIYGEDDYFKGRSMDVFITKLRKYLSEDSSVEIINIHGTGFKLVTPE